MSKRLFLLVNAYFKSLYKETSLKTGGLESDDNSVSIYC